MDKVFPMIHGILHHLWRAEDQDGNVLDTPVAIGSIVIPNPDQRLSYVHHLSLQIEITPP